jgi:CRP-like cAMP-binding protein
LRDSFLFTGIDDATYARALELLSGELTSFAKGETIYSPNSYQRKVGFVVSGECEVCRIKHDGGRVKLNTLLRGESFGISAVFSDDDFPTVIYAARRSEVIFVSREELLALINAIPEVALNIIRFQNSRIAFLNKKIETFSAGTVEEKLACLILDEYKKQASTELALNRMKTADKLGVGRASLYRALDSLADSGVIKLETKKIFIIDPKGLERITK